MIESDYQKYLVKGLKSQGHWAYKISDLALGIVKPFDIIASFGGQATAFEVKLKKYKREGSFKDDDLIVREADFQAHQIPTLMEFYRNNHGDPYIAAGAAIEHANGRWEKRLWFIPAYEFGRRPNGWTVGDLEHYPNIVEAIWIPAVGWQFP